MIARLWPLYFGMVVCAELGVAGLVSPGSFHRYYQSRYQAASPAFRRLLFLKWAVDNSQLHTNWIRFVGGVLLLVFCFLVVVLAKIE